MTGRIFVILIAALVGLSGCDRQTVYEVQLPDDVAAVTEPFFAAVRRGDQKAAEKFMAPTFVDDSKLQFAEMSALLKKSPSLTPAIYQAKPGTLVPDENEVVLIFAAKDNGRWISANLRMYRPEDSGFEIEYWDVKASPQPPPLLAHAQTMRRFTAWLMVGLALMALIGLGLLIWIVKRRTHIVAPEPVVETRRVAITVRDGET